MGVAREQVRWWWLLLLLLLSTAGAVQTHTDEYLMLPPVDFCFPITVPYHHLLVPPLLAGRMLH